MPPAPRLPVQMSRLALCAAVAAGVSLASVDADAQRGGGGRPSGGSHGGKPGWSGGGHGTAAATVAGRRVERRRPLDGGGRHWTRRRPRSLERWRQALARRPWRPRARSSPPRVARRTLLLPGLGARTRRRRRPDVSVVGLGLELSVLRYRVPVELRRLRPRLRRAGRRGRRSPRTAALGACAGLPLVLPVAAGLSPRRRRVRGRLAQGAAPRRPGSRPRRCPRARARPTASRRASPRERWAMRRHRGSPRRA